MTPSGLTLVMGPSRSGKSRWAEHLAHAASPRLAIHYLATGADDPDDAAWQVRLARHRARRPSGWTHHEVGSALAPCLASLTAGQLGLVDSLGSWVAQLLEQDSDRWMSSCRELLDALRQCPAALIVVSEQVGWGVVPPTRIGGLFRDRLGELEQQLMPWSQAAWLVVAGRALDLKAASVAVPEAP